MSYNQKFVIFIILVNLFSCLYASVTVYNEKNQSIEIIDDYSARFGPSLPDNGFRGYLAIANPRNACLPIQSPPNASYVNKWIALIQRTQNYNGNCSFDLKVLNAQNAGFSAVIIYNSDSDRLVRMSSSGSYNIKIPSVFIGLSDGLELERFYTYQNKTYLVITEDEFNAGVYLIPFAVIVGACFIIMLTIFVVKCAIYYHKTHKNRLSKSALKKLPVKKYQKSDKYDTCPICLDEFEEGVKIRILPCEHVYHVKCIDEWLLKNNRSCPVCKRKVLPGDDSDDDSSNDEEHHQRSTTNSQQTNEEDQHNNNNNNNNDDQPLLDAINENDYENEDETSRLLNSRSINNNSSVIISMIPNQSINIASNNDDINVLSVSNDSNSSHYGSITKLNNSNETSEKAGTSSTSPQVKLELDTPAIFTKIKRNFSGRNKKKKEKNQKIKKQDTASAYIKNDDSDDELIGINDNNQNNNNNDDDDDNLLTNDDTRLLIPVDVQTTDANSSNNNNNNKNNSKIKKDLIKSV